VVDGELDELLSAVPALLVDGAKGVGKTVTASRRAGVSGHGILTGDGRQGSPLMATSSHQWWPSGFTSR
jgi:hypothetical protein